MSRLPTIFFGHGSPIIALQHNATTILWRRLAKGMARPRAIVCVSAHWLTHGTALTGQAHPPTIHDFSGFPREMHEFEYPAPGDPQLVRHIQDLLAPLPVQADHGWGFDHGCWTVLMKAWPNATIPVVQLSLDMDRTAAEHYAIGQKLAPLRDEGVLIMGSGNIVHNLRSLDRREEAVPHSLAESFSAAIRSAVLENRPEAVINFPLLGEVAKFAVPTPDHFWPLLYVLGARLPGDEPIIESDFVQYGAIDMTTISLRNDFLSSDVSIGNKFSK